MEVNRKLILITTQGCQSCEIASKLTAEGVSLTQYDVELEKKDVSEVSKQWLKQYGITDFPTLLFMKNDSVKHKVTGTWPAIVIARWINVQLK